MPPKRKIKLTAGDSMNWKVIKRRYTNYFFGRINGGAFTKNRHYHVSYKPKKNEDPINMENDDYSSEEEGVMIDLDSEGEE